MTSGENYLYSTYAYLKGQADEIELEKYHMPNPFPKQCFIYISFLAALTMRQHLPSIFQHVFLQPAALYSSVYALLPLEAGA